MRSSLFTLLSLSAQLHGVESFWRMICDRPIVTARIDPIISPGAISAHTHAITGASNVGYASTYDDLVDSDCTTCQVTQDHSAYWVPQLYYTHQNGTYESVDMVTGITVYYLQRGTPGPAGKILAIPNGLRMIAGDPFRRSYNASDVAQRAIGFSCLGGVGYVKNLEDINNCPNGLRAEVFFPNCWDGINLDSADHTSHMAYSGDDGNGDCPSSHPVKLVSLFYEAMWGIDYWKDSWWNGTSPPFVFAQGDPTGYGSHGDFMSGWDSEFLQTAVDQCTASSGLIQDCPLFNLDYDSAGSCQWAGTLATTEDVLGKSPHLSSLPGCNPVTYGPAEAPVHPTCNGDTPQAQAAVVVPSSSSSSAASILTPVTKVSPTSTSSSSELAATSSVSVHLLASFSSSSQALQGASVDAEARTMSGLTTTLATMLYSLSSAAKPASTTGSLLLNPIIAPYANATTRGSVETSTSEVTQVITTTIGGVASVFTTTSYTTLVIKPSPAAAVAAYQDQALVAAVANTLPVAASPAQSSTSFPTDHSSTAAAAAAVVGAATAAAAPAAVVDNTAGVPSAGGPALGNVASDNVVYVTEDIIEYVTLTQTLYSSASPYVQLYVLPKTATSVLPVSTTSARRTVTSTVTETRTVTTRIPNQAYASMPVNAALPSMGVFYNYTISNNTLGNNTLSSNMTAAFM